MCSNDIYIGKIWGWIYFWGRVFFITLTIHDKHHMSHSSPLSPIRLYISYNNFFFWGVRSFAHVFEWGIVKVIQFKNVIKSWDLYKDVHCHFFSEKKYVFIGGFKHHFWWSLQRMALPLLGCIRVCTHVLSRASLSTFHWIPEPLSGFRVRVHRDISCVPLGYPLHQFEGRGLPKRRIVLYRSH